MGFKTLLVPLDGGDVNTAVLETALAAAQRFQAHIEVLYVPASPFDTTRHSTFRVSDRVKQTIREAAERGATDRASEVRAVFDKFCRDHALTVTDKPPSAAKATASWREETGHELEVLVRRGRLSDLIFVPRPDDSPISAQTFETALLDTGRPVVLVPPKSHDCIASRITIGWNASAEAARAVAAALPCLASAEVTVLASQKRAANAQELVDYLAWHGIKPAVKIFEAGSRSVGETLLGESRALGADLLLIGGYTHTRARQLLFGGVTRYALQSADIPVMMVH